MARCGIGWYTFKPESLAAIDAVAVATNGSQDSTLSDINMVTNGVVMVCLSQVSGASSATVYSGIDTLTTDQAFTSYDGGAMWLSFLSIQPTETIATRDISFSSGNIIRRNYLAVSFGVQGTQISGSVSDAVQLAQADTPNVNWGTTLTDVSTLFGFARHTAPVTIEEALAEAIGIVSTPNDPVEVTVQDFVRLQPLLGLVSDTVLDEPFTIAEATSLGMGNTLTDAMGMGFVLSAHYAAGRIIPEGIGINDAASTAFKYVVLVTERQGITETITLGIPVTVADTVAVAFAQTVVSALSVIERLGLADTLLPNAKFGLTRTDTISLLDGLRRFFAGDATDQIGMTETVLRSMIAPRSLSETVGIAEELTKKFVVRIITTEEIDISHTQALKYIFSPVATDHVEISAAYISPNENITTWAINTKNMAVTEYTNYNFNSFAQMGRRYLGASSSGLYALDGDDDEGTDIVSQIKSGLMQLGGSRFSGLKTAYLGMRGSGDFVLKVETGDGKTYTYAVVGKDMETTRVHMGKGLRARYFAFELISTGQDFDLDDIEFVPLVMQRRV